MKIIKETIDPDQIALIDRTNSIIISTPSTDSNIVETEEKDIFSIILTHDVNLSMAKNASSNILIVEYLPRIRVSVPDGILMQLTEPNKSIFYKMYTDYDIISVYDSDDDDIKSEKKLKNKIYSNLKLTLYTDVIQMRNRELSLAVLNKGQTVANMYFTWYIREGNIPIVENIYIIKDSHIYQDFIQII